MSSSSNQAALFEPPKLAVEKLPQLRAIFERVATTCVDDFKTFMSIPFACFLNQVEAGDSWDVIEGFENCIAALYYVPEWDVQILISMEKRLISTIIDVMFGGDGTLPASEQEHIFTKLELDIAKEVFARAAGSLSTSIAPLAGITPAFDRLETELEFTILGPQNIPSVFAQLLFQIADGGGRMFMLLPRAPLMPMRKQLERGTLRESQAEDPKWTNQLQSRVSETAINVRAVIPAPTMSLDQISKLQVGQVIELDPGASGAVSLESASTPVFTCSLGQLNGKISVKISEQALPPRSLSETVISSAMARWNSSRTG